ncbi:MAG: AAA family ATPase [Elusimicrobia bacterium]|nr:AAA family ATPase [Elusimicrobiota bacterium]
MNATFERPLLQAVTGLLAQPRKSIHALIGPRWVGKSTLIVQALKAAKAASDYASVDGYDRDAAWIAREWEIGRNRAKAAGRAGAVLVLDEVQKVPGWPETIKRLWDEDSAAGTALRFVMLSSEPALALQGLNASLAGRFEVLGVPPWSYAEMKAAFGWGLEQFLYFGAYPAGAQFIAKEEHWRGYMLDLAETTLSRDIHMEKPALLRQLFRLGCDNSARVLSYRKMLDQLQHAGNPVTLAGYLQSLSNAGLLAGLQKYPGGGSGQRGSSPKLLALNNALITSGGKHSFAAAQADKGFWGRLVESAVGAQLVNGLAGTGCEVFYWRELGRDVDFVIKGEGGLTAVEVSSSRGDGSLSGLERFSEEFHPQRKLIVGEQGIPLEEFLCASPEKWLRS